MIQKSNGVDIARTGAQNNPFDCLYIIGDSVTDGSARYNSDGSSVYLQQLVDGVWKTLYIANPESTTVLKSLMAGTGSFHLGGVHSIGSAGENVIFKNNITGVNWFPAWQGVTSDGTTIHIPTCRTYSAMTSVQPAGPAAASGTTPFTFTTTLTGSTSFYNFTVVPAETYSGMLTITVTAIPSNIVVVQLDLTVAAVAGESLLLQLDYPLDGRVGKEYTVIIQHPDGSLFNVLPSTTSMPWHSTNIRPFQDSNVWHNGNPSDSIAVLQKNGLWQSPWTSFTATISNASGSAGANTAINFTRSGTVYGGVVGYDSSANPLSVTCSSTGLLSFPVAGTYIVRVDGHVKCPTTSDVSILLPNGTNTTTTYNTGSAVAVTNCLVALLAPSSPWESIAGTCVVVASAAGSSQLQYEFVSAQSSATFNGNVTVTRIA